MVEGEASTCLENTGTLGHHELEVRAFVAQIGRAQAHAGRGRAATTTHPATTVETDFFSTLGRIDLHVIAFGAGEEVAMVGHDNETVDSRIAQALYRRPKVLQNSAP